MTNPALEPAADAGPRPYQPTPEPRTFYRDPRLKSPVAVAVLSLMPGLGQVFLGYTRLGFIHAATVASLVTLLSSNQLGRLEPAVGVFLGFFWMYNLVDAYRRTMLLNEAVTRMETPQLPDSFQNMTFLGRIGVGVVFIVGGLLSLLHLRFGVSMAWLADWWPAGVLLFGIYLVVKALKDRQEQAD